MMARGLDHIAHAVRDLDAAADLYARLGFLVGARNRHPWGTHNRIVQLPGFFIELLTVAEPEKLGNEGLSRLFGRTNQTFLRRQEGFSILFLESQDATLDAAAFKSAGIAASAVMNFEREGKRPDGNPVKVAFSLAFARDGQIATAGFAVCQHHYPENFWNLAFHDHANTARTIAGVVLAADNPADHHIFFSAFAGERELLATSSGITVRTPRGEIQVMNPAAFRSQFSVDPPDISAGARLAALRFGVKEMPAVEATLKTNKVAFTEHRGRIVVGPDAARGATIVFEPA
jgi:catechol 2,3-dioxygenase-like lactoylglutathione lyase family enzyme